MTFLALCQVLFYSTLLQGALFLLFGKSYSPYLKTWEVDSPDLLPLDAFTLCQVH